MRANSLSAIRPLPLAQRKIPFTAETHRRQPGHPAGQHRRETLESLYHAANSIDEDTCDPVAFAGALEDARAAIEKAKGE